MKRLLWILLAIILFAAIGLAAVPSILSSEWGKKKLAHALKSFYHVDVKCDRLSLTWFGHQEITNLVCDTSLGTHFDCDIIKTEATLFDIFSRHHVGHLYFDRPNLTIAAPPAAPPPQKKHRAKQATKEKKDSCTASLPFSGALICSYGKLQLPSIAFDDIQFEVENALKKGLFAHMSCTTTHGEKQGIIHLDATCLETAWNAKVVMTQLPMDAVAALYPHYGAVARAALGESADISFSLSNDSVHFSLDSPQCKVQDVELQKKETLYTLQKPISFTFKELQGKVASLTADVREGYKVNALLPSLSYSKTTLTQSELALDYQEKQNVKLHISTQVQDEDALALFGERLVLDGAVQGTQAQFTLSGPLIDGKINLAWNKGKQEEITANCSVQTQDAGLLQFSLKGTFSNGVLQLQEPLHAQAKITRAMSRLVLKEVNPLSLSYLYSEGPITIDIPAKGFSLSCQPFSIEKSAIPSARIQLGKIACRNEGNIHIALDLLKANQFDSSQELLLWFAPLDLHLSEGTLDIERTEILLANTFDIALWGQLYFPSHDVDMMLGLPAQTLRQAFSIQNLPADYVLTIPMTGKTDNVKINTTKATAKIALLLASQQKALSQKKGGTGALIGGLLQQMVTLPDNGKAPPAKHPFPWEK